MTGLYATACEGKTGGGCQAGLIYTVVILFALVCGVCASFIWVNMVAM